MDYSKALTWLREDTVWIIQRLLLGRERIMYGLFKGSYLA